MVIEITLILILLCGIGQIWLMANPRKPGPRKRKKVEKTMHAKVPDNPKKRYTARDYPEVPMK